MARRNTIERRPFTIRFSRDTQLELRRRARRRGLTLNDTVVELVEAGLGGRLVVGADYAGEPDRAVVIMRETGVGRPTAERLAKEEENRGL